MEEAFAPLVHARTLAYALESCDPRRSYMGSFPKKVFYYYVVEDGKTKKYQATGRASMIVFPAAYEVLYELYNTMLIERMRARRATKIPTDAKMRALRDAVYYKRLYYRRTSLKWALDPAVVFPDERDFRSAGLEM